MNVFISWSGRRSGLVAEALKVWLKRVIQAVRPWVSSADILAGSRWNQEIAKRLADTKFGIICVTPENLDEPWIQFEAGALAKTVDQATFVCPYLFGLTELDARNPLSQFQCKSTTEQGTFDLVRSVHAALSAAKPGTDLTHEEVKEAFTRWWPELKERLDSVPPEPEAHEARTSKPDTLDEILALARTIAASVSNLQAQMSDVPALSAIYGAPLVVPNLGGGVYVPGMRGGFREHLLPFLLRPWQATGEEKAPELTREVAKEEAVRSAAEMLSEQTRQQKDERLTITCPNCGKTDGVTVIGLAHKVDDDRARHLTIVCGHCSGPDERRFGVHISQPDKRQLSCQKDCPYHPRDGGGPSV